MKVAAKFALPARQTKEGESFETLGTLASLLEDTDVTAIGDAGITIICADGSTQYVAFSKNVQRGIQKGLFKAEHLGNLIVGASTYKDEEGVEQNRLKLTVPQGLVNSRVSAKDLKEAATANPLVAKTVKLSEIKLSAVTA